MPAPLVAAASLAGVEALGLAGLGVLALADVDRERLTVGLTVGAFLVLCAAGLGAAAWSLSRGVGWGRGPVLIAQLIVLGAAWTNREALPVVVTAMLAVTAVVTILGVVHPASVERLARDHG